MGDNWNEERRLSLVAGEAGISSGCVVASKEATEDVL